MKQRVQTYLLQKPVIISAWAFMAIAVLIFLSDLLEIPRMIGMHTNMTGSWLDGTIDGVLILLVGAAASEMISRIDREKRQSEMKYASLVEQANDSIVILKNGEIVFANQKMSEITGFSLKEIGHRSFLEFIAPEDREMVAARYRARLTGEDVPKNYEARIKIKDNSYLPAEINASLIEYEGVPAIMAIIRDISERQHAEEALRTERENYHNLLETAPFGIQIVTHGGKIAYVNHTMLDLWGYGTVDELRSVPLKQRYSAASLGLISEMAQRLISGRETLPGELTIIRKDGRSRILLAYNVGITWDGEKANQIVYQDITERKKAESALKESEEKLRLMFHSVSEGIVVADLNGQISEVTGNTLEILGANSREEIIGRSVLDFVAPSEREIIVDVLNRDPREYPAFKAEIRVTRFDGRTITVEVSSSAIKDAAGMVIGSITILRDITEVKKIREQLVAQDRLASIGQLVSGVAHELNNPLTSVIGFSELILENEVPEELKENLTYVYTEAQRASRIVKDLLTFARKHAPVRQASDINSIIEDVLRLRAYDEKISNIAVVRQMDPDIPQIMVDYYQLQQVIFNIVINAEFFMTEAHKQGTLTVKTERGAGTIRIAISDDGPGIAKENFSKVFEPFYTTKEVGKGTGLGLSICHGIIAEHGGRIYAECNQGQGATFIVELPICVP